MREIARLKTQNQNLNQQLTSSRTNAGEDSAWFWNLISKEKKEREMIVSLKYDEIIQSNIENDRIVN